MAQVRPFRGKSGEGQRDVKDQLARTRFSSALSGTEWTPGMPPRYLAEILGYWRTEFDRGGAGVSGGPRGRDPWVLPSAPLLINNSPISGSSTNHLAQDG